MKKLLIVLGLAISIVFAGNIVGGVELGKKVPKSFKKIGAIDSFFGDVSGEQGFEYKNKKSRFFNSIAVEADVNGTARTIIMLKKYNLSAGINLSKSIKKVEKDFQRILNKLENKYGNFDKRELSLMKGKAASSLYILMSDIQEVAILKNTNSDNIGRILLIFTSKGKQEGSIPKKKEVSIGVAYLDKYTAKKMEEHKVGELDEL